jgi:4-hydroxy-4-methyl-2-oxoglutarate aldolase
MRTGDKLPRGVVYGIAPCARGGPLGYHPAVMESKMTSQLNDRFEQCYTAAIHDVMRSHGLTDFVLPREIRPLIQGVKVAGPAFTLDGRIDTSIPPHETYLAWTKFLGDIPPGSIGICQPNDHTVAHMGELSAETLKSRDIKGYVVDGGCRDTAFIRRIGFPVWCRYATPADIVGCWIPESFGGSITIASVHIRTGDYILADDDGIVVIPDDRAREILDETEEMIGRENLVRQAILDGMNPQQAYLRYRKF